MFTFAPPRQSPHQVPGSPPTSPGIGGIPGSGYAGVITVPGPPPLRPAAKPSTCPTCGCSAQEATKLTEASGKAQDLFANAAQLLNAQGKPILRRFDRFFGGDSAHQDRIDQLLKILNGAAGFLASAKIDQSLHCDSVSASKVCQSGVSASYRDGQVIVCTGQPAIAKMIQPPSVPGQEKTNSEEPQAGEDKDKTAQLQEKTSQEAEARLTRVLAHEAVHSQLPDSAVDVYRSERLFPYLGGNHALGLDLSPVALANPDSIVSFVFNAQELSEKVLLPGAEAALQHEQRPEGAVRPLLGSRMAQLALAIAEEAIEQSKADVGTLQAELGQNSTTWSGLSTNSETVRSLLVQPGGEAKLRVPGAAAAQRIAAIYDGFSDLDAEVTGKRTILARRFRKSQPDQRIEIAIPDWKEFRKKGPAEQVQVLIQRLLKRDARIAGLAGFVWALAKKRGGFGQI
jgi:hypothetical protein